MVDPIDAHALFERVKAFWPQSIALGDNPLDALHSIYWPLEERLGHDDEWLRLGAWALHQSLWEQVSNGAASGNACLIIGEVPFSTFDRNMRENLAHESWLEERVRYGVTSA